MWRVLRFITGLALTYLFAAMTVAVLQTTPLWIGIPLALLTSFAGVLCSQFIWYKPNQGERGPQGVQ